MDIFGRKAIAELRTELTKQKEDFTKDLEFKTGFFESQLKAMQTERTFSMANALHIFPEFRSITEHNAYQKPPIYSVVSKLATTSAMIPMYGFDKKAETDLPETDKLVKFLQTLDFEEKEKLFTYLYLYGEVFALKNKIDFGVNKGLQSLRFLHPAKTEAVISEGFPGEIVGYIYRDAEKGINYNIAVEDMFFHKYFNPTSNRQEEFRGMSPVKVLGRTLVRLMAAEDASTAQLQNGGIPGIIFPKTIGTTVETAGKRGDNLSRFFKNPGNKGAPYSSADELGYIEIGTPLTDMELIALQSADFDMVCNAYGISSVLFNNKSASTESNVQQMVKEMYTNTIIPNVYRIEAALNKSAVPDIDTKGIIKCDLSEIKALQEDATKQVSALVAAWWLTGNEKRDAMDYDQDTANELMNTYILPSGSQLIDDLEIKVEEVDNEAGDYNNTGQAAKILTIKTGTNG